MEPSDSSNSRLSKSSETGLFAQAPTETEFDQFLSGEASEETAQRVKSFIDESYPSVAGMLAVPGSVHNAPIEKDMGRFLAHNPDQHSTELAFKRLMARANSQSIDSSKSSRAEIFRSWWKGTKFAQVAATAAIAGIIISGVGFYDFYRSSDSADGSNIKTIASDIGQTVNYILPDGSSALLAPGSKIQFNDAFGDKERSVELQGEVLFNISQQVATPFVIRNGENTIRVLGTTFSVRKYINDSKLSVVVVDGKVSVNSQILVGGEAISIYENGKSDLVLAGNSEVSLAWTVGNLAFRRTPLHEAIPDLERWYGVSINVDPELLEESISGTFLVDEPVGTLKTIAMLLQADLKQVGKRFVITKK